MQRISSWKRHRLLALAACLLATAGCSTLRSSEESDIPWNAPAAWEGVPAIPGFSQ